MIDAWDFKWESVEQEKGFGNLVQYLRKHNAEKLSQSQVHLIAAYFVQKDHESNEWWSAVFAQQTGMIREDLAKAYQRISVLESDVEELRKMCKSLL